MPPAQPALLATTDRAEPVVTAEMPLPKPQAMPQLVLAAQVARDGSAVLAERVATQPQPREPLSAAPAELAELRRVAPVVQVEPGEPPNRAARRLAAQAATVEHRVVLVAPVVLRRVPERRRTAPQGPTASRNDWVSNLLRDALLGCRSTQVMRL